MKSFLEETEDGLVIEVIFRQITTHCPTMWLPGLHWYVELHVGDRGAPVGIAFVTAMPGMRPKVEWIFIQDKQRRKGWGSYLLDAVSKKWPYVDFLVAASKEGQLLINSWERRHKKTEEDVRQEWKAKKARDEANGKPNNGEQKLDGWVRRYRKAEYKAHLLRMAQDADGAKKTKAAAAASAETKKRNPRTGKQKKTAKK